jgi:DivIVA domain-containing protein
MAAELPRDDLDQLLAHVQLAVGLRGYDCSEVDALLARLRATTSDQSPGLEFGDKVTASRTAPSPTDVRRAEFRLAIRGYATDQVDVFLERVARALAQRAEG